MNSTSRTVRSYVLASSCAGLLALLTACGGNPAPDTAPSPATSSPGTPHTSQPSASASAPPWSYEGATGPEYWGELDTAAAACGTGTAQSPIDVDADSPLATDPITLNYSPSDFQAHNTAHSVEFQSESPQSIEVAGTTYTFKQLHYHSPSEHTVDGKTREAEFHLVHQSDDGALAVVGVLVDAGERNAAWAPVIDAIPRAQEQDTTVKDMDLSSLLPRTQDHHAYDGSLTTPPCTENVRWLLLREPVEISEEQIRQLRSVHADNNRPTQPLNDRSMTPSGS